MKIGFTGTRNGTTGAQFKAMCARLHGIRNRLVEARHGCCVGCDVEFVEAVRGTTEPGAVRIVAHPPTADSSPSSASWRATRCYPPSRT